MPQPTDVHDGTPDPHGPLAAREIEEKREREQREEKREREQKKRARNVMLTFLAAFAAGIAGLVIFALSVVGLPSAAGQTSPRGADGPSTTTIVGATAGSSPSEGGDTWSGGCAKDCPFAPADVVAPTMTRIIGLGGLAGGTSALLGALVGFLFGLPRMPTRSGASRTRDFAPSDGDPAAGDTSEVDGESPNDQRDSAGNNTLIEISDWLAKIIVGAGLVGMKDLTGWVGRVGTSLGAGAGLGSGYMASAFGATVIMYFFTLGFLFAYINTRTVISLILATTDRSFNEELRGHLADQERRTRRVEARLDNVKANVERVQDDVMSSVAQRVDERAEENRIFGLLYNEAREAKEQAVKLAREFLAKPGNERNAQVWLYLACANGQLHATERDTARKASFADEAYVALARAIEYEPGTRAVARGLLYSNATERYPGDNDLESLNEDPRFRELIPPP